MKNNFKILLLHLAFALQVERGACAGCDEDDWNVPAYLDGCDDALAQGGIAGYFAIRCDMSFTDITDEAEWDAKIAAGEVFGRSDGDFIRGQLPAAEREKIAVGACGSELTIGKNFSLSMFDAGYDAGLTKYDLYDYVDKKSKQWNWGFILCDGSTYGPYSNVNVEVDEIIPETNATQKEFQINMFWKTGVGVSKPVSLPFLVGKQLHP
jgi:hypothetical protein